MLPDLELMMMSKYDNSSARAFKRLTTYCSSIPTPLILQHPFIHRYPQSSHSSTVMLHTISRDSCDVAPETPQLSSLESGVAAPDSDSTVTDDYYEAVQHALTENYATYNPQESMQ
jgi:hypothetical protein